MKKPTTHQNKEMLKTYYHKLAESKGYTIHFPLRFSDVSRGNKMGTFARNEFINCMLSLC